MRKFLYLAISILLLTLISSNIFGAAPDSCLTLIWPNSPPDSYNPDHVMKDTCKDSPTYGEWYARGTWSILMDYYIFNSLIPKTHRAYLNDIDSIKYPKEKEAYRILDKKFGKISFFRDPYECDNEYDSEFVKYPCLDVELSRYNREQEVEDSLYNVPGTIVLYLKHPPFFVDIFENINTYKPDLFPNPCNDKLKLINLDYSNNNPIITIYNYLGTQILSFDIPFEANNLEIDVRKLNEGIYFININNNLLKFIKLR